MNLPVPFLSEATYMCLFPILIYILYTVYIQLSQKNVYRGKAPSLHQKIMLKPTQKAAAFTLSLLYITMTSVTEVLKGYAFNSLSPESTVFIIRLVLLLAGFISVYFLICRLMGGFSLQPVPHFKKLGKTPVYLVLVPVILLSFFSIAGCYPGIVSSDSANSWAGVMGGYYSDWHPLTYLYILKVVQKLFGLPYPIIIFQAFFWIFIQHYALSLLEKYAPYRHLDTVYVLLNIMMLSSYRALGNLEKDTLWNMGVFLFCLCIFDIVKTNTRLSKYNIFLLFFSVWVTGTIRHGGILIVIITLVCLVIYKEKHFRNLGGRKHTRLLVLAIGSLLVIKLLLVNLLGFAVLKAEPNEPYIKYSIPMSMIGAVAVNEQPDKEAVAVMETIMPLDNWQEFYDKYYADGISRSYGGIGDAVYKLNDPEVGKDILKLNVKFLFQYPKTYLTAFFDMTSIVWEMGTPADGYEWMPISIQASTLELHPELSDLYIRRNISTAILEAVVSLSDQAPVWSSICWRGGFALFTFVLSAVLLIQKKRGQEGLALLPAFLLAGVLFLANPSQDPRYINSYQMIMCFFLLYAFFADRVYTRSTK
jgi:hypothetical protein